MTEEENALEKARALFESGAEVVYVAVGHQDILVEDEPPDRPGTIVTARSIAEVRRFLRDVKLDREK